jgi:hypothetical protein
VFLKVGVSLESVILAISILAISIAFINAGKKSSDLILENGAVL